MDASRNGHGFVEGDIPTFLVHPNAGPGLTTKDVVTIEFSSTDGQGVIVPLFTNPENAKRFLEAANKQVKGVQLRGLKGFDAVERLLVNLEKVDVTHVQFNAMPPESGPTTPPIPIGEVIASLRNRPR